MVRAGFCLALYVFGTGATACPTQDGFVAFAPEFDSAAKVYVGIPDITVSQPFKVGVEICGAEAFEIERIKVDAMMPTHQHGMNYAPDVTQADDGLLEAFPMVFHMPGDWQITVETWENGERKVFRHDLRVD